MPTNLKKYITPLLAAAAATVAIAAAPTAFAADHQSCNGSSSGTVCQSPGNVKFKASPPHVQFHPYGDQPCCSSTTKQVRGHGYHILVATFGGEGVASLVAKLVVNRPISLTPNAVSVA